MLSKHLQEVMAVLNKPKKIKVLNKQDLMKVSSMNFCPNLYDDIIFEFSTGKILYCRDFEFCNIHDDQVVLGNYTIMGDD
jgi:hypothetical protein